MHVGQTAIHRRNLLKGAAYAIAATGRGDGVEGLESAACAPSR